MSEKITLDSQAEIIKAQQAQIDILSANVDKMLKLVATPTAAEVAEEKVPTIPEEPVKIGSKKYQFAYATFMFNTAHYEAQDAALDAELLKEIIAVPGQGLLTEVF